MVATHRDLRRSTAHQAAARCCLGGGAAHRKLASVHEAGPTLGQQFCQLDCVRIVGQARLRRTLALDLALMSGNSKLSH